MPEIKNMFQKGVMNKDLDERLVPNGQYRNAMNVQVSTSEDSDVGTVQNILGNIRVEDIVLGEQFKCVGAIADEKNDVLYWFITSPTVDAIVEYHNDPSNQSTNTCIPILVDTNKDVLKFDPSNIITGINIIDNLLFWTDDVNEPKKINIDTFKLNFTVNNYTDLNTHSQMFVNETPIGDVTEDHITVIRKRPQKAPVVTFTETAILPIFTIPTLVIPSSEYSVGDIFPDPNGVHPSPLLLTDSASPPYSLNDEILLSDQNALGNLPQNYQIKVRVTQLPVSVSQGYEYEFEITEIKGYIDSQIRDYNCVKVQENKPIFEKEFIRFAFRYKYQDGEYSAFSPFTQPVFLAGVFGFHPTKDPYNLAMENKSVNIKLQELIDINTPRDVVQLDVLFKKERSTTVYSIDSIKQSDSSNAYWDANSWGNKAVIGSSFEDTSPPDISNAHHDFHVYDNHGEYEITTENIYAALPNNQMLRPWDNVPRKALSQEVTANRIIYGNYLQNYNFRDVIGNLVAPNISVETEERKTWKNNSINFDTGLGEKSIKSDRTYYLGVVYGDEHGRETPVFTSKNASINVPYDFDETELFDGAASKSLRLKAKLLGNQPEWAYYYKWFIKQTTGEYYNLTMDRVYRSQEDSSLWLSFPSSDRNKVQEGDYFSIKKQVDIDQQVPVDNKIKIIDIKNEAPEHVKQEYKSLGVGGGSDIFDLSITSSSATYYNETNLEVIFPSTETHPSEGRTKIEIRKDGWTGISSQGVGCDGIELSEALTPSDKIALQFEISDGLTTTKSLQYEVAAYDVSADIYEFKLKKKIKEQDSWVESTPSSPSVTGILESTLKISILLIEEKDAFEFEGRFFVKVLSNIITQTYLTHSLNNINNWQVLSRMKMYNLTDSQGDFGYNIPGIHNLSSSIINTTSYEISDTELEWDTITTNLNGDPNSTSSKGWFIDGAGFASVQHNSTTNAYKSGIRHYGKPAGGFGNPSRLINGMEKIAWLGDPNGDTGLATTASVSVWGSNYYTPPTSSVQTYNGRRAWTDEISYAHPHVSGNHIQSFYYPSGSFTGWTNDYNRKTLSSNKECVLHLSFACPGVDLHDGDFSSLSSQILTAWSGFTMDEEYLTSILRYGVDKIKVDGLQYESTPAQNTNGTSNPWNGEWYTQPSNYGYSGGMLPTYRESTFFFAYNFLTPAEQLDADNAFEPTHGAPNPAAVQAVIDNLVLDSRFFIEGDSSVMYRITQVYKKHLYNHTAWNITPQIREDGVPKPYGIGEICVAKRVRDFLKYINDNGIPVNQTALDLVQEWIDMKAAIVNFGRTNNRRTLYTVMLDEDPRGVFINNVQFPLTADASSFQYIRFVDNYIEPEENVVPVSPAIFETEAKEDVDLNVYYEASDAMPITLDGFASYDPDSLKGYLLAPVGSRVTCSLPGSVLDYSDQNAEWGEDFWVRVKAWDGNIVELNGPGLKVSPNEPPTPSGQTGEFYNRTLKFWKENGSYTSARIFNIPSDGITGPNNGQYYVTKLVISNNVHNKYTGLPFFNCFSFGNGVESNRIRDDFNESYILNGVKASTVLEEPYEEERRKHGLIYSGLYNSTSGVNNLNQFIQAEKITKDLMPSYGSIQKLYARDKDLITLCEDKIIRVYVDKDILYNADGNTQLLATNRVLGTAEPFRGNFGISKNPESFAAESFRSYFTDKQRGAVIRLSMDGLTPISDAGMHDYFRDNLRDGERLYGSYDAHKGDYNLSIFLSTGENLLVNPGFNQGGTPTEIYGPELLTNWDFSATTDITTTYPSNYAKTDRYQDKDARLVGWSTTGSTTNQSSVIATVTIRWVELTDPHIHIGDEVKTPGPQGFNNPPILGSVNGVWEPSSYPGTIQVTIDVIPPLNMTQLTHPSGGQTGNPYYDPAPANLNATFPGNTLPEWQWRIPWVPGFEFTRPSTTVVTGQSIDDWTYQGFEFNTYSATVTSSNAFAFHEDTNPEPEPMLIHDTYNLQAGKKYKASFNKSSNQSLTGVVQTFGDNFALHDYTFESGDTYSTIFDIVTGGFPVTIYQQMGDQVLIKDVSLKEISYTGGGIADWSIFPNPTSEVYFLPVSNTSPTGPGYIEFDDASVDSGIEQFLSVDYPIGTSFTVSFNITNLNPAYQAEITMYMYNSAGNGFEYTFNQDNNYVVQGTVSDTITTQVYNTTAGGASSPSGWNLGTSGVFGFRVSDNYPYKFQLDDVSLIINSGQGSTLTFNERSKGWTSFKSFVPEFGLSCVNQYYTMSFGQLWKHHVEQFSSSGIEINRNTFYGTHEESSITPILNMHPAVVKNFNTLNYEGSQSKIDQFTTDPTTGLTDGEYYNLQSEDGWYVSNIRTDKQEGTLNEFIEKEGKWFNYIKGKPSEIDTAAFNFQGLGIVETID